MSLWESNRVLVTGGCGNIGSYLVEELISRGAEVVVADNLESGSLKNIEDVREEIEFYNLDLRRYSNCLEVVADAEVVFNLAGRTHGVGYSDEHHGEMLYNNTVMQFNVLEAARVTEVERFMLTSSSCVYPDDAPVPTPELPVGEGLPEQGNKGYGWSKRIAELQGQFYDAETQVEVTICRPFNVYGDRYQWRGEGASHVIPALVKRVMDDEDPLTVWGSGQQSRNFLHSLDVARYMIMLVERNPGVEPINIGFEEQTSISELVSVICDTCDRDPEIIFDTSMPEGAPKKGASSNRLREIVPDYEPEIDLRDGIEEMKEWYEREFN
ncbi:hypothetical protein BRD00_13155 [Halobacteriales archaeon QS_8_69_26]|nr:MAG: hypothetical protein BRD00_13155 [Halobacteriales archaeon QS_8_69_26]